MATGNRSTWWREMGAISRGMMFLEGAIATPASTQAAQDIDAHAAEASAARDAEPAADEDAGFKRGARWLVEELALLGGRPLSARRMDDLDEPFPPLHPWQDAATARNTRSEAACATC